MCDLQHFCSMKTKYAFYTHIQLLNHKLHFSVQVQEESFLEVINNMLSTGEVANLYKAEEFEEVKNNLHAAAVKAGILQTSEAMYTFLIDRVRSNLHIILCMSPIGDSFR